MYSRDIEDGFLLRDNEKLQVIAKVYSDIFVNKEHFAKLIGVGRSTVYEWFKEDKRVTFNTKSKSKISQTFGLLDTVWSEQYRLVEEFEKRLNDYKKIEHPSTDIDRWILVNLKEIDTEDNQMSIERLSLNEIDVLLSDRMKNRSASFMFEVAQKLKSQDRVHKALEVLGWIEEQKSSFWYIHENRIRHFKAVLLSHEQIQAWDEAIDILRSLYHGSNYHLKEPEILTLLASNYKRKALYSPIDTKKYRELNEVDMELMTSALCLYEDAYKLKPDNAKYYDAVNIAYLYNIIDTIEKEYANKKTEITSLYKELSMIWRIDKSSWWEVGSDAELLMLLGEVDLAIIKIGDFLENYSVKEFDIKTTIRQLELYIHFSDDINAKRFLKFLKESFSYIKES